MGLGSNRNNRVVKKQNMNEITYIQHNTHFTTPDKTIEQLFIESTEQNGCTGHVIKFSHKPFPYSLVNWGLITSLSPMKCYGYDWMFKLYYPEMIDILEDKIQYNKCVEFVSNVSFEELLKLLGNPLRY